MSKTEDAVSLSKATLDLARPEPRLAGALELAAAALLLLSDHPSYIAGRSLVVYGGFTSR